MYTHNVRAHTHMQSPMASAALRLTTPHVLCRPPKTPARVYRQRFFACLVQVNTTLRLMSRRPGSITCRPGRAAAGKYPCNSYPDSRGLLRHNVNRSESEGRQIHYGLQHQQQPANSHGFLKHNVTIFESGGQQPYSLLSPPTGHFAL